jgi:hypothetical protein
MNHILLHEPNQPNAKFTLSRHSRITSKSAVAQLRTRYWACYIADVIHRRPSTPLRCTRIPTIRSGSRADSLSRVCKHGIDYVTCYSAAFRPLRAVNLAWHPSKIYEPYRELCAMKGANVSLSTSSLKVPAIRNFFCSLLRDLRVISGLPFTMNVSLLG